MLYDKEFSEKKVNTINENDSGYIVIREEIDFLSETKKVSIYCKEEIRMDLIEKLESNGKEVINTLSSWMLLTDLSLLNRQTPTMLQIVTTYII